MAKKTAWSIGNARKKAKKPKAAKPTAAAMKGTAAVKGFGMTKEKLAKLIGEMTAADALDFLAGPEPGKAGISEDVVEGLRTEIAHALEAKKAAAGAEAAAAATSEAAESATGTEQAPLAALAGPEDDSEEAMRKWREYCAEALAAAEKLEAADGGAFNEVDEVPLFKPRSSEPLTTCRCSSHVSCSHQVRNRVRPTELRPSHPHRADLNGVRRCERHRRVLHGCDVTRSRFCLGRRGSRHGRCCLPFENSFV